MRFVDDGVHIFYTRTGCGEFKNLSYFAELMNKTGKPILVEDCHWGGDGPGDWGDGGKLNQGANKVTQEKWYECLWEISVSTCPLPNGHTPLPNVGVRETHTTT